MPDEDEHQKLHMTNRDNENDKQEEIVQTADGQMM